MGRAIDMELLSQKNELTPAIGNVRVNARGDELGPGGKIIRKREEIMAEYYNNNPNAVKDEHYVRQPTPPAPAISSNASTSTRESTRRSVNKKEVKDDNTENTSDS